MGEISVWKNPQTKLTEIQLYIGDHVRQAMRLSEDEVEQLKLGLKTI